MKNRFTFSVLMVLFCLLVAAGRAFQLYRKGWPLNDGLLIAMVILSPIVFVISFIWYTVRQNHGANKANRVIVIPIALAIAIGLLGWAGYILYLANLDDVE